MYNLGIVNHAHVYDNGKIGKHMYAHIYNEGEGKKGANNVASLIVKTLRQLNLLQEDSAGGELNIRDYMIAWTHPTPSQSYQHRAEISWIMIIYIKISTETLLGRSS